MSEEKAVIGVLITLENPPQPMRTEAASSGYHQPPYMRKMQNPRLQILSNSERLEDKTVDSARKRDRLK